MACARTGFFVTRATGRMSRLRRASCGRGESKSCEKERGAEVGLRAHLTAPVMDTCRQATNWRPAAFLLLVANHPDEHAVEGDMLELRHGANLGQHPAVLDPARPREDALQWAMDALVDVISLGSATGNSSQLATAPRPHARPGTASTGPSPMWEERRGMVVGSHEELCSSWAGESCCHIKPAALCSFSATWVA